MLDLIVFLCYLSSPRPLPDVKGALYSECIWSGESGTVDTNLGVGIDTHVQRLLLLRIPEVLQYVKLLWIISTELSYVKYR